MKLKTLCLLALVGITATEAFAPPPPKNTPMKPKTEPPPPVTQRDQSQAPANGKFVYEQQPISGLPTLVSPEQAQAVIERFQQGYRQLDKPRILIYVNRDLVDEESGYKLASRTENVSVERSSKRSSFTADKNEQGQVDQEPGPASINADGNITILGDIGGSAFQTRSGKYKNKDSKEKGDFRNTYRNTKKPAPKLADRQTVRDVERLFGRPLRHGGAILVDQRLATQFIPSKPLQNFTLPVEGQQAKKDRAAVSKIADVVLEILISSRTITAQEVSGARTYTVPDIQATAIRLEDSRILGQATASDILGKDRFAGRIARQFDVRDIAEATALALMEDMMIGVDLAGDQ